MMSVEQHDTIFDETKNEGTEGLAEINFELLETGSKWLVKVISGPNSGAEFFLMPGASYLIGNEEASCDIVFNDLSVSRQHARLSVDAENHVFLEDLGSKNGTFIDGEKSAGKKTLLSNALITTGTTTCMLIDRESEHHTIVSPQFGPIKKEEPKGQEVTGDMKKIEGAVLPPIQSEVERIKDQERKEARYQHAMSAFIVLALITGLFIIAGVGTMTLFRSTPVEEVAAQDPETLIDQTLKDFSTIHFQFNPANGKLFLLGHLGSTIDKSRMKDLLSNLKFISSVDDSNVIIDELVWREMNSLLSKNPAWKSVTMTSTAPGRFQLSGFLKNKKDADELFAYISQNFSYPELLEKRVIVEEDLKTEVAAKLLDVGFRNISIGLKEGELILTGTVGKSQTKQYQEILTVVKTLPGIRQVTSYVTEAASEQAEINISDRYQITGFSALGKNFSVVINGKIVTKGDTIDGMTIIEIRHNSVLLEKDGFKYRIDFNK
jgi:type III secretion system YscD/HrpQ family protein